MKPRFHFSSAVKECIRPWLYRASKGLIIRPYKALKAPEGLLVWPYKAPQGLLHAAPRNFSMHVLSGIITTCAHAMALKKTGSNHM